MHLRSVLGTADDDGSSDDEDESSAHPLVRLGAINSFTDTAQLGLAQTVILPKLTKNNTRRLYRDSSKKKYLDQVIQPLIGVEVCKRNARKGTYFECTAITGTVQIGGWKFTPHGNGTDVGVQHITTGTCSAWFAIKTKYVPHLIESGAIHVLPSLMKIHDEWTEDTVIYGKFHRFLKLVLPYWHETGVYDDREHLLGECTLWYADRSSFTGLPMIDLEHHLTYPVGNNQFRECSYVPLKWVESMLAVAPVVKGWPQTAAARQAINQAQISTDSHLFVMPLQL